MEERIYNVPLKTKDTAKNKRARKALLELKRFLKKHMKGEEVHIKGELNKKLWAKGIKKPQSKVKIRAQRKEGIIKAQLKDLPIEEKKPEKKPKVPAKEETKKSDTGKTGKASGTEKTSSKKTKEIGEKTVGKSRKEFTKDTEKKPAKKTKAPAKKKPAETSKKSGKSSKQKQTKSKKRSNKK